MALKSMSICIGCIFSMFWPASAHALPTAGDTAAARQWVSDHFRGTKETDAVDPAFSFVYDREPSTELLSAWKLKTSQRSLDKQRTERALTYTDPKTGLEVRCVAIEYHDFPAVEWVLYFQNTSDKDTPILEDVQALALATSVGISGQEPMERVLAVEIKERPGASVIVYKRLK